MPSKLSAALYCGCVTVIAALISVAPALAGTFVYVSNQEDGDISVYTMAPDSGMLTAGKRAPAGKLVMPMASSPDGKHLYATIRTQPFSVSNYRIDAKSGELKWLGSSPLPASMVIVALDRTGRWLLAASYAGHVLSVHPIGPDGRVAGEPTQVIPSGGRNPHWIRVDAENRFVYVPNLGTDEVRVYKFDAKAGTLTPADTPVVKVKAGTGPRKVIISKDNRFLYLLGELTGVVTVFERDNKTGALKEIQAIESVPANSGLVPGHPRMPFGAPGAVVFDESKAIWAADIQVTPDGKFLFTSERTHNTISSFAVDTQSGQLRYLATITTEEKQPRGIAIDPEGRFLVVSGEKSQNLSVYAFDSIYG
jgi:6-phosphogluconolactonase